jgi:hypothetical protein
VRNDLVRGFLLGIWLVLMVPGSATAHDATDWFNPIRWDNHHDVNYKIDDSIPGGGGSQFEDRIHDAVSDWNAITGVDSFHFDDVGNANNNNSNPCDWEDNAVDVWVYFHDITPPAQTTWCFVYHSGADFTDLQSAKVQFDSNLPSGQAWYKGTGSTPSGEIWVKEAALHEFGHVTGTYVGGSSNGNSGGHWIAPPSAQCASNGDESDFTMCPFTTLGHAYLEPLDTHDIHTFQDFY